jgi:hypothetical protein
MFTQETHLMTVGFKPYREGMGPKFKLTTWDTGRTICDQYAVGYCLAIKAPGQKKWEKLFEGEDFGCSPMHAIDSNDCCAAIMCFLTLRPGDTDTEYFANYTPEQLEYCNQHAEALSCAIQDKWPECE